MKRFIKGLTSTKFILALSLILNLGIFIICTWLIGSIYYNLFSIVGLILCLWLISKSSDAPAYKIMWLLVICIAPLFGVSLYLYLKEHRGTKKQRKQWQETVFRNSNTLEQNQETLEELKKSNSYSAIHSGYILNTTNNPVYSDTSSKYLNNGEEYFKAVIEELKKAKHFIFVEYFIIKPGKYWEEIFNILRLKAREGVEIKLLYDDFGCIDRFDDNRTFQKLDNHGIETLPFNKIKFRLNQFSNYRDHRKIIVVDNNVALTGGINLADEYAKETPKYGKWKDSAIQINGAGVWTFTVLFLNMWEISSGNKVDPEKYKLDYTIHKDSKQKNMGFVQPFACGPLNPEPVLRNTYINMINTSKDYVYITTPYFILDTSMREAIKLCAKSGVKVKLFMPGKPDKRWVYFLSRSYYWEFIKCGVEIYEYTPGFLHQKTLLSDGNSGVVGTINMDFRSLYLHYEDAVALYHTPCLSDMKTDIEETIESQSHLVTLRDIKQRKWYEKFIASFLKIFAPLM